MRKVSRKVKNILILLFIIAIILGIKEGTLNIAERVSNLDTKIEVSEETTNFLDKLVKTVFTYEPNQAQEEINTELTEVTLVRVVDGDTIVVNVNGSEEKVRMIGVDTPESVHSDSTKNNEYGDMASTFTKEYMKNYTTLYLQYDVSSKDQYGRTLAYVWLEDDVDTSNQQDIETYMYNAILLKEGYAINKEDPPNTAYADVFEQIRDNAELNNIGLWENDDYDNVVYG